MLNILKKNNHIKIFLIVLVLLFQTSFLISQERALSFELKKSPFKDNYWFLDTNNKGLKNADVSLNIKFNYLNKKNSYQIEIVSLDSKNKKIYIGESYFKKKLSDDKFLQIGKYYRNYSNYLNDSLSSGHMIISHNAQPIPKIGFFVSKDIKKLSKVNFDFGISHGHFSRDKEVLEKYGEWQYRKSPLLHEKFIYVNIVKKNYELSLGLVHNVMWAGATPGRNFPITIRNYSKVFFSGDGYDEGGSHQNALGNHIGIWDFSIIKKNNNQIMKIYYQHIFEDTSGLRFANLHDGLWGAELVNYLPNTNFLIEYLVTSNQLRDPPYVRERYYTNYQYKLGWSYKGYSLGNPYIDYLSVDPIDVIHFGIKSKILSNDIILKLARKTTVNDSWDYKVSIQKKFTEDLIFSIFIVNNNNDESVGMTFSGNF